MALSEPATDALPSSTTAHLRRCWYRRLTRVEAGGTTVYDVECMLPRELGTVPLGDLETARRVCNTCAAGGVFRPDED
jgi:hypothetical protein